MLATMAEHGAQAPGAPSLDTPLEEKASSEFLTFCECFIILGIVFTLVWSRT